jgi:hypothetical protein
MRKLVLVLLLGLAAPLSARAQSVTLDVCNTGTIDIDVFVSQAGAVSSSHITSSTCGAVVKGGEEGILDTYLGLAFADSRGQWGAPRRFDHLPDMGIRALLPAMAVAITLRGQAVPPQPKILAAANKNASVRHGNATVTLPLQLLFQPSFAGCKNVVTDSTTSFVGRQQQTTRAYAKVCEDLVYTLTVEAHADSREASLGRLATGGFFEDRLPSSTARKEKVQVNWADVARERTRREAPEPVSWTDLVPAFRRSLNREAINSGQRFIMPGSIKVRGTVSGVEFRQHPVDDKTNVTVAEINFRESPLAAGKPYPEFNVCTTRLDVLQEVFGADFRTSMIGKTIEVRGKPQGLCWAQAGEIEIFLARQVRPVESAQFAAGTRTWAPPAPYVAPPPPPPTREQMSAETAQMVNLVGQEMKRRAQSRLNNACANEANKRFAENRAVDPIKERQESAACAARAQAGAEQEGQKAETCARELLTRDPRMRTDAIYEGVAACMQAR